MRRRTTYVILVLIVVTVATGVVLWRYRVRQNDQEGAIRSATVERGPMTLAVTTSGRIEPEARVGLTFEAPGRVAEIYVAEGDRVERGDTLGRLEADQLELRVEQAQAALDSVQAQLAELRSGPRQKEIEQAEASLRAVSEQLSAAQARRDQLAAGPSESEIASAEARIAQAWAAKEVAQDAYDRIEEAGTRKEQANYDLYTAKQELAAAEAQLEDLLARPNEDELRAAEANIRATEAQRDASRAQLNQLLAGSPPEDIVEAEAQVAQAGAALALAELSLRNASLRAPYAGVVAEVNVRQGETPPTRQPAFVLLDDSAFHLTIQVDELDVARMEQGQEAELSIEALPGTVIPGTVNTVAPIATTETGVVTYDVLIDLATVEAPIRADMTANATIVVEQLADVLQIPAWVVQVDRETGQTFVERRVGDEIDRVNVELGVRNEGVTEVLSGLSEGDEVVRVEEDTAFELSRQ